MIEFHELTMEDRDWMNRVFQEDDRNACEYSFANNFMWRKVYHVEVAEIHGCCVARFDGDGEKVYSYPIGKGDKRAVIQELLEECRAEHRELDMSPVSEADRKDLLEWFPGQFLISSDRDDFDYIYTTEKLSKLSGKKLASKRNHIARFKDDDDWVYEEIHSENKEECRSMTYHWISMRQEKWNEEMEAEMSVVHEAFDNFEELGLVGGLLRKAGEIVAFTLGEPLNSDTFVVHFEKAFPEIQGAYPMINQQFVLHACQDYAYVNREEDTGDPGLRKAKLSYRPDILLTKYAARSSEVVFADPVRDRAAIQEIWSRCFGDDEEFIDYYIQNRMEQENMLVIHRDGRPVSMASFLPAQYVREQTATDGGDETPETMVTSDTEIRYVYAVATLPEYRGLGLATKILQFGLRHWNVPLVLCPAEEELQQFYGKMGFVQGFHGERRALEHILEETREGGLQMQSLDGGFDLEEVEGAEYQRIRDAALTGKNYVRWDASAIQYAIQLNAFLGGKTLVVKNSKNDDEVEQQACTEGVIMYYTQQEKLNIIETTLKDCCLGRVLQELMEETKTSRVESIVPDGMILLPNQENQESRELVNPDGYLNLTLG